MTDIPISALGDKWRGYAVKLRAHEHTNKCVCVDVADALDKAAELAAEHARMRVALQLIAESEFPESLIRGYLPGQRITHAVERWSLQPFCDAKGLLIIDAPFNDSPSGWEFCPECVTALSAEEAEGASHA